MGKPPPCAPRRQHCGWTIAEPTCFCWRRTGRNGDRPRSPLPRQRRRLGSLRRTLRRGGTRVRQLGWEAWRQPGQNFGAAFPWPPRRIALLRSHRVVCVACRSLGGHPQDRRQPALPTRRCSAAAAMASFFRDARLPAAENEAPSRTASAIRALDTRPKYPSFVGCHQTAMSSRKASPSSPAWARR